MNKELLQWMLEAFRAEYSALYESGSTGDAREVVFFDEFLNGSGLVKAFAEHRKDFISSDREAAAFTRTFFKLGAELGFCKEVTP